jgi:sulfur carrier protein ThiS
MQVTVKLFATFRDYLPPEARRNNALGLEVEPGITVQQLIGRFNLPECLVHLVLVNGSFIPPEARASTVLGDGDQLAVWPPIAGG